MYLLLILSANSIGDAAHQNSKPRPQKPPLAPTLASATRKNLTDFRLVQKSAVDLRSRSRHRRQQVPGLAAVPHDHILRGFAVTLSLLEEKTNKEREPWKQNSSARRRGGMGGAVVACSGSAWRNTCTWDTSGKTQALLALRAHDDQDTDQPRSGTSRDAV